MERPVVGVCAVAFVGCECHQRPERASRLALWRLPVQTILLAGIAEEIQSVLLRASILVTPRKILGLGIRKSSTDIDDIEFVPANTPRKNLILSRSRIEEPLSRAILLQRNWKGEVVSSDQQDLGAINHFAPAVHLLIGRDECVDYRLVLHSIARGNNLLRIRAEDCQQGVLIP